MALHRELLEQATHLASRERRRPKQASLRRAISAAYYGLFHLLIRDVAAGVAPNEPDGLRERVQRTLAHTDMKTVCKGFVAAGAAYKAHMAKTPHLPFPQQHLPAATFNLLSFPFDADLIRVASTFVELQDARHEADYDTASTFNRVDVLAKIQNVDDAYNAWLSVKSTSNGVVFKTALLLQKSWAK